MQEKTKFIRLDQYPEVLIVVLEDKYLFIEPKLKKIPELIFQFINDSRVKCLFFSEIQNIEVYLSMDLSTILLMEEKLTIYQNIL